MIGTVFLDFRGEELHLKVRNCVSISHISGDIDQEFVMTMSQFEEQDNSYRRQVNEPTHQEQEETIFRQEETILKQQIEIEELKEQLEIREQYEELRKEQIDEHEVF